MLTVLKQIKDHCKKRGTAVCEGCCFFNKHNCEATELGLFDNTLDPCSWDLDKLTKFLDQAPEQMAGPKTWYDRFRDHCLERVIDCEGCEYSELAFCFEAPGDQDPRDLTRIRKDFEE